MSKFSCEHDRCSSSTDRFDSQAFSTKLWLIRVTKVLSHLVSCQRDEKPSDENKKTLQHHRLHTEPAASWRWRPRFRLLQSVTGVIRTSLKVRIHSVLTEEQGFKPTTAPWTASSCPCPRVSQLCSEAQSHSFGVIYPQQDHVAVTSTTAGDAAAAKQRVNTRRRKPAGDLVARWRPLWVGIGPE